MSDDTRLIEDFIPADAISAVASSEKVGGRKGHPALLHLWWARRPLAAARAAVYATLVPAADTDDAARSAGYFHELCKWGASEEAINDARRRVLAANGGVPPKVLDLFAGGGAIPLEAARLGCDATAVELNPVAHLIERCTLDYPKRFGPSLADDIRICGRKWVQHTWERVGHLYPAVRDEDGNRERQLAMGEQATAKDNATGRPFAYLWTRTIKCPNPALPPHELPLVRQTWMVKKKGRYVALKPVVDRNTLTVGWQVVEADKPEGLGFDPAAFSQRGQASCLVCGATADSAYVKAEGLAKRMSIMPLAAVLVKSRGRGRDYLAAGKYPEPGVEECEAVIDALRVKPPDEPIIQTYRQAILVPLYGLTRFRDLFTPRQLATLCAFAQGVHDVYDEMCSSGMDHERARAISAYMALTLDRVVDRCSTLCRFDITNEGLTNTYARQALPMVWDFGESNPFARASGSAIKYVEEAADLTEGLARISGSVSLIRHSASQLPNEDSYFDAVITDPPYYDNISYADLSDFFYVWLKRSTGFLFPEHFSGDLTPKRREAVMASHRHGGDRDEARRFYEDEMAAALKEAHRVLKPGAPLVCVYAHKTTLGWATLVEALRRARFTITEAWPLDTEMPERSRGQNSAALASSIFLVARRRDDDLVGDYVEVRRELDTVIAQRLDRLLEAGVAGSDLVIATMGAGLTPFTRYAEVQLPNGDPLPTEKFLEEVQARVISGVLSRVHGLAEEVGGIDPTTRYYVFARYSYGWVDVDFDEANNLARMSGIELSNGFAGGPNPLARITKRSVHLRDFEERGSDEELGLVPGMDGQTRIIDVLHGLLWRAAHKQYDVRNFLVRANPDPARLKLIAQALQGKGLRAEGEQKPAEAQACERLLASWRSLVEDNIFTGGDRA